MKQNISRIFNRRKLLNNRLYQLKIQKQVQEQQVPHIFSKFSIDILNENLSYMKKEFRKSISFMGKDCFYFLETAPSNVNPRTLFLCDIAPELLEFQIQQISQSSIIQQRFPNLQIKTLNDKVDDEGEYIFPICCDEELWPFDQNKLELIVSSMNLQWVNDLQTCLLRFLNSLEPDGVLLGCFNGPDTLQELRIAYTLAENERYGGISQHISPFVSITEIGNLITRLNFTLPTVFTETKQLEFDGVLHLLQFLQDSGESEALYSQRKGVYKNTLDAMISIYNTSFKNDDKIISSFEFVNFTGWKYDELQPRAKKRGLQSSADFSLKQLKEELQLEGDQTSEIGELEEEQDENDQNENQNKKL